MRIAIASDNRRRFTQNEAKELRKRGHVVEYRDGHRYPDLVSTLTNYDLVWCDFVGLRARRYSSLAHKFPAKLVVRVHAPRELRGIKEVHWQNCALVIFDNPAVMAQAVKIDRWLKKTRLEVVHLSVDTDLFAPAKDRTWPASVGMCGMVRSVKQIPEVLKVLHELRLEGIELEFLSKGYLSGEVRYMLHLERLAKELGVPAEFLPWGGEIDQADLGLDDPRPKWFSNVGVIVSNSEHEGTHLAIAEGMACSCCAAVRNWLGADSLYPKEVMIGDGYVSLKEQLKWYAKLSQQERRHEGEKLRKFAEENFGIQAVVSRLEELFSSL